MPIPQIETPDTITIGPRPDGRRVSGTLFRNTVSATMPALALASTASAATPHGGKPVADPA